MQKTFIDLVKDYFRYLVEKYEFSIAQIRISKSDPQINGRIEYNSSSTFVVVSGERGNISVIFGRLKDNERTNGIYKYFLSPSTVYEYISLSQTEKDLVCSLNPKDEETVIDILNTHRLKHKRINFNNLSEHVESNLQDYAVWLHKYAHPFLCGDFSDWLKLYEYKITVQRAAYIRSGKDEYVLHFLRLDENGKPVHKRRRAFQASYDYLEKLREEY